MQVTNNTNRKLGLPNGVAVGKGLTVEVKELDTDNAVIKAWIDSGFLSVDGLEDAQGGESNADEVKPLSKMNMAELKEYIVENGGEFDEADKKDALLANAQAIEDDLNQEG